MNFVQSAFATIGLDTLRRTVMLGLCAAVVLCVFGVSSQLWPRAVLRLLRHVKYVDARLRYLRVRISAWWLVGAEAVVLATVIGSLLVQAWLPAAICIAPLTAFGPALELACSKRTARIEGQLDHWLSGLAGSLRVSPALGQALIYSCHLVASPLRDELITATEELALGVAVDDALARMGRRIGSRTVQSAIGTLRIGRNTGGELPGLLERSAGVLREMARLEGVFRTKTAEGRAQASIVSIMPFAMLGLLHAIDPSFTAPLFANVRGHMVLAVAGLIWVAQIFLARRILRVDY